MIWVNALYDSFRTVKPLSGLLFDTTMRLMQVQQEWTGAMQVLRPLLAQLPPLLARAAYLIRLQAQIGALLDVLNAPEDADLGVDASVTCACYCVADDLAGLLRLDPVAAAAVLEVPAASLLSPRSKAADKAAAKPNPAQARSALIMNSHWLKDHSMMQIATSAGYVRGEAMKPTLACPGPLVQHTRKVFELHRLPAIAQCLGESAFGDRLLLKVGCGAGLRMYC
jgi:hypothetical protein